MVLELYYLNVYMRRKHEKIDGSVLKLYTVDSFIFVGTNFRGLNKNNTFMGFKVRCKGIFYWIIHTENWNFVGTGIRWSDLPRKPRKLEPNEIEAIHSI